MCGAGKLSKIILFFQMCFVCVCVCVCFPLLLFFFISLVVEHVRVVAGGAEVGSGPWAWAVADCASPSGAAGAGLFDASLGQGI